MLVWSMWWGRGRDHIYNVFKSDARTGGGDGPGICSGVTLELDGAWAGVGSVFCCLSLVYHGMEVGETHLLCVQFSFFSKCMTIHFIAIVI